MTVYSARIMRSDELARPPLLLLTHYRDNPPVSPILALGLAMPPTVHSRSPLALRMPSNLTSRPFVFVFCHAMSCRIMPPPQCTRVARLPVGASAARSTRLSASSG